MPEPLDSYSASNTPQPANAPAPGSVPFAAPGVGSAPTAPAAPAMYMPTQPAGTPMGYAPLPAEYNAVPTAPVKKRGKGGVLVWLLGGCGVLALLLVVVGGIAIKNVMDQVGKSDLMKNRDAIPTAKRDLMEIRTALQSYRQQHGGSYPDTLDKLVDSSLLSYQSNDGTRQHVSYRAPRANASDDTSIARYYVGQLSMSFGQRVDQRTYICLLKNGQIVQEQVTRTALPGTATGQ